MRAKKNKKQQNETKERQIGAGDHISYSIS